MSSTSLILKRHQFRLAISVAKESLNGDYLDMGSPMKQQLPPECTYDDVADASAPKIEGPRSKYERLENRICELEEQLRHKERESSQGLQSRSSGSPYDSSIHLPQEGSPNDYPPNYHQINFEATGQDIYDPSWPRRLPNHDHLKHLLTAFLQHHPHATRLIHVPSFMASLSFHPTHPRFPAVSLLHAVCAMGSLYTRWPDQRRDVTQTLYPPRDIFAEVHASYAKEASEVLENSGENLFEVLRTNIILSWFYWAQSKSVEVFMMSSRTLRLAILLGLNLSPPAPPQHPTRRQDLWSCSIYFKGLQNHELDLGVHATHPSDTKGRGQPSEQRPNHHNPQASPNGVPTKPPLLGHIRSESSMISEAENVLEEEIRRNAFWLAYATEREQGCGNGWALSLDDNDVGQATPLGVCPMSQGMIEARDRQWAHDADLLIRHPPNETDSFTIYIKGTILISMVKTFNLRFRSRYLHRRHNHDFTEPVDPGLPTLDRSDINRFMQIDHLIASFLPSFPNHLRNPIKATTVDNHLYTASLMPHVATIILHDPHAEIRNVACVSAMRILSAARSILDLVHDICSTSYDVTLLDYFCSFCWFVAGRVLVRFLQAAVDAGDNHYIAELRAEVDFLYLAIARVGQQVPLAFRFARTLDELVNTQGRGSLDVSDPALTFPRPSDPSMLIQLCQDGVPKEQSGISLHETLYASGGIT
uniref:Xylanolytic transcriptional activator regulatory domain-containing protein n=1 Tax=Moniliophthora roreri TaxID=221103 RepID=A0A0W0EXY3_MONRR